MAQGPTHLSCTSHHTHLGDVAVSALSVWHPYDSYNENLLFVQYTKAKRWTKYCINVCNLLNPSHFSVGRVPCCVVVLLRLWLWLWRFVHAVRDGDGCHGPRADRHVQGGVRLKKTLTRQKGGQAFYLVFLRTSLVLPFSSR